MSMEKTNRELTFKEKRRVQKLVISLCANYDPEHGCLILDCNCYMLGVRYAGSSLCRCFRDAVLPTEPELQAVFKSQPLTVCKECGKGFPKSGKRAYCSEKCAAEARRKQTAARVRKHRAKEKL